MRRSTCPSRGEKVPVIRPRKAELVEPFKTIIATDQARELEEHWRLLYVGMTRASERLVVAGIEPSRGVPENSWHKRVERALASLHAATADDSRWGSVARYAGDIPPRAAKPRIASGPLGQSDHARLGAHAGSARSAAAAAAGAVRHRGR